MSIHISQLAEFVNPIFVETGTYTGLTIQKALDLEFSEIYSIEISPELHAAACELYAQNDNVHVYLGDSSDVLRQVLTCLTAPTTFWLDAHNFEFCPEHSISGSQFPLLDELALLGTFPQYVDVVLIDDIPSFDYLSYEYDTVIDALRKIHSDFVFRVLLNAHGTDQIIAATRKKVIT